MVSEKVRVVNVIDMVLIANTDEALVLRALTVLVAEVAG